MSAWRGSIAGAAVILIGAASSLACRAAIGATPPWLAATLAAIQITALVLVFTAGWPARYRAILVTSMLAIVAMATFLPGLPPHIVELAVAGSCHAAAYIGLLTWFALSLRPNREPVITHFARAMRQTMPQKVERYTRHATIAWCLFFSCQLFMSLALLLLAPLTIWSAFINLLNLPLVLGMALAEFACRAVRFRHEPHTGLIDTIAGFRRVRRLQANRP